MTNNTESIRQVLLQAREMVAYSASSFTHSEAMTNRARQILVTVDEALAALQAAPDERELPDERKAAEQEYTITAFDYERNPVGSHDWCLYWAGWLARSTALQARSSLPAREKQPEGMVLVPHYRGYANLGTGNYLIDHSAEGEIPELVISIAPDHLKAGRKVGDKQDNNPATLIQPEQMAVRIRFENVEGLNALVDQLSDLRNVHFPASIPEGEAEGEPKKKLRLPAEFTNGVSYYATDEVNYPTASTPAPAEVVAIPLDLVRDAIKCAEQVGNREDTFENEDYERADSVIKRLTALTRADAAPADRNSESEFKNFHRVLCERFGYRHDEMDWKRDQISLIEFIAKQSAPADRDAILEEAAMVCDRLADICKNPAQGSFGDGYKAASEYAANDIRELKQSAQAPAAREQE